MTYFIKFGKLKCPQRCVISLKRRNTQKYTYTPLPILMMHLDKNSKLARLPTESPCAGRHPYCSIGVHYELSQNSAIQRFIVNNKNK